MAERLARRRGNSETDRLLERKTGRRTAGAGFAGGSPAAKPADIQRSAQMAGADGSAKRSSQRALPPRRRHVVYDSARGFQSSAQSLYGTGRHHRRRADRGSPAHGNRKPYWVLSD